ncbi:MAG: helix-turn-helix domain-containing protein [Paludibacter sp.]|jgi:AraC-like DNA-binding protein|nr:helix-turn-helix domain-containing protein [Paludibacter sp.]
MERKFMPQNWQNILKDNFNVSSADNDFILVEGDLKLLPLYDFPFKTDMTIVVICTKGTARGNINLSPFEAQSPCMIISFPNQIFQYEYISTDYEGFAIVMSSRFFESLFPDISQRMEMTLNATRNHCLKISNEELQTLITCCQPAKMIIDLNDNPYRLEMLKHLSLTFFYVFKYYETRHSANLTTTPLTILAGKFMELVKDNFKQERHIGFYADQLSLTPKYLSLKIKEITGKSAADWINDYTILEAKALLKSTNMTIQQISDEMNFPSQSFFGKYFKRQVGVSPKEYKK